MSVPVALVGHSKAPPSLGHAAPHELGAGVCGDRALCLCGRALDVGRNPGLPQIGNPWLHLPAPAPLRGGAYHPGLGIPGWASVCDFWGGGPETVAPPLGFPMVSAPCGIQRGQSLGPLGSEALLLFQIPKTRHVASSEGVGRLLRQAGWGVGHRHASCVSMAACHWQGSSGR